MKREKLLLDPKHPYVILCEGMDEKQFLIQYLYTYLVPACHFPDAFLVYNMGGNEELSGLLPTITKVDHFRDMKSFLIVRDAETDRDKAERALSGRMKECFDVSLTRAGNFAEGMYGIRFGFVLLPGATGNGTLEDLCVRVFKKVSGEVPVEKLLQETGAYLERLKALRDREFRTVHKNRLHAYLAGTDKFVGMKIGEAAKAGCFDFSSPDMQFLQQAIGDMICK